MSYVTVSVPITTDTNDEIEALVKSGEYANRADYIRKALLAYRREQLLAKIREAEADYRNRKTIQMLTSKKDFLKLVKKYA